MEIRQIGEYEDQPRFWLFKRINAGALVRRTGCTCWLFSVALYLPTFSIPKLVEGKPNHTFLDLQNRHARLWPVLLSSALCWGGIAFIQGTV
jgi:hypothetical protein